MPYRVTVYIVSKTLLPYLSYTLRSVKQCNYSSIVIRQRLYKTLLAPGDRDCGRKITAQVLRHRDHAHARQGRAVAARAHGVRRLRLRGGVGPVVRRPGRGVLEGVQGARNRVGTRGTRYSSPNTHYKSPQTPSHRIAAPFVRCR